MAEEDLNWLGVKERVAFTEICVRGSPWIELIFQREIGQCLDTASV